MVGFSGRPEVGHQCRLWLIFLGRHVALGSMTHSFVAYIDESGDDGLGNFREPGKCGGASHWLVVSACVFRRSNDLEAVRWRDEILARMQDRRSRDIHFKKLSHAQRVAACQALASKPVRAISIFSGKRTAPEGVYKQKNQLYFYATRYLVERISWLCRDMRPRVPEGDGRVKIVFSRRGGMSYEEFRGYLLRLKESDDDHVKIHWPVIDIDGIDAKDHSRSASLQLADVVASAFACGVEPDPFGNCELRYAEELAPIVYQHRGRYVSYGIKMLPNPADAGLTVDQQRLVQFFERKGQSPGP